MSAIQEVTDANWREIAADEPVLLLLTAEQNLRGDVSTQFKTAASQTKSVRFLQANARHNPELAAHFQVKEKPVLVAYLAGETLVRRIKPWGTDVTLAIELLEQKADEREQSMGNNEEMSTKKQSNIANNLPLHVNDQSFQQQVIDYSNEAPVVVDFWAEWCGPCRMVAPILDKLAGEYAGKVRIAKVDVDQNPGLSQTFRVASIPTIQVWKDGHLVFSQPGAFPEPTFRQLIDQVIELDVQAAIEEQQRQEAASETQN